MALVVFLDTNMFLQFKPLQDVDWRMLFPGIADVVLVIPMSTVREIDKLKGQANSRRANRAREANSLVRRITAATNESVVIREAPVRVECRIAPGKYVAGIDGLDYETNDGKLLAEAQHWIQIHPGDDVSVLTDDATPFLNGKRVGIRCVSPPDAWRLPPESDEVRKELRSLRADYDKLRAEREPEFEVGLAVDGASVEGTYATHFPACEPLAPECIDALVQKFRDSMPPLDTSHSIALLWDAVPHVNKARLKKYLEEEYPEWLDTIRDSLSHLHDQWFLNRRILRLVVTVKNTGSVVADGMRIDVEGHGCKLTVLSDDQEGRGLGELLFEEHALPPPPEAPQPTAADMMLGGSFDYPLKGLIDVADRYDLVGAVRGLGRVDTDEFVLKEGRYNRPEDRIAFQCGTFSHHARAEQFSLLVMLPREGGAAAVKLRIVAANTRKAVEQWLRIKCEAQRIDGEALVLEELRRLHQDLTEGAG